MNEVARSFNPRRKNNTGPAGDETPGRGEESGRGSKDG